MGQMKTIETYTPLITTPYVFHLEDDYEFFDSGLGFFSTDEYKEILRKHVGSDITDAVAIGY